MKKRDESKDKENSGSLSSSEDTSGSLSGEDKDALYLTGRSSYPSWL